MRDLTDPGYLGFARCGTSQLCPDKFVIRHVLIQGMDYPVPPKMDSGRATHLIDVRYLGTSASDGVSNAVLLAGSNLSAACRKRQESCH
jgi:hypothetical protein